MQASRKRYHLAAFRLGHVARTLVAVFRAVRAGDLTLITWGRMATSELIGKGRYAELSGRTRQFKNELDREKLNAFRKRLDTNLPTASALLDKIDAMVRDGRHDEAGRARGKVARLLYELGVKTQKVGGLVAEAEGVPPEEQGETRESLAAGVALARRREAEFVRCKKAMAEGNVRLVWAVARRDKYSKRGHSMIDLIGEGHSGLMRAVEKFDPGLGLKFSTLATYWIERAIKTFLGEQRNVRVPTHTREVAGQVHWARGKLAPQLGREPTYEEVAEYIRRERGKTYTAAQAERADLAMRPEGFLDTDPDGEDAAGQSLAAGGLEAPDALADEARAEAVHKVLAMLPYRDRTLLHLRLGFGDGWKYTLAETGYILGVSRESVRMWEKSAYDVLRTPAVAEILAGHL